MKKEQMFEEILEVIATILQQANNVAKDSLKNHLLWFDKKSEAILDENMCATFTAFKRFIKEIIDKYEVSTDW